MDIGNPGGIVLTVNGKKLGSPGTAGQPVTLSLGPGEAGHRLTAGTTSPPLTVVFRCVVESAKHPSPRSARSAS